MTHGIFDQNTHIDTVFGRDVATIPDAGYGWKQPCEGVLYGLGPAII